MLAKQRKRIFGHDTKIHDRGPQKGPDQLVDNEGLALLSVKNRCDIAADIKLATTSGLIHISNLAEHRTFTPGPVMHASN
jgi:hypothetical protein